MVLILALYHGFAAVTSTININFSTVDSSILSSSRQHLKEFHYYFQGLLFCAIIAPASPLWNFPEARNRKGTGRAYKWGKYVMLIRGGGSNNQFWIHYLWEGLIEQFICDSFNWGELISDWLNIILCQTIIWNRFSFISPVPPNTLSLPPTLTDISLTWPDPIPFRLNW